jgi:hypothetical protein
MSYKSISEMTMSSSLRSRVTACAAQEMSAAMSTIITPDSWVNANIWRICSAPGWDESWEYALAVDPESDPGANEAAITDAAILAQVQALLS